MLHIVGKHRASEYKDRRRVFFNNINMFGTIKFTFDIWVCEMALLYISMHVCECVSVCMHINIKEEKAYKITFVVIEIGSIAHIRWRRCDKVWLKLFWFSFDNRWVLFCVAYAVKLHTHIYITINEMWLQICSYGR